MCKVIIEYLSWFWGRVMLIEQLFSGDFRLVHVRLLSSGWQLLSCCLLSLVQLEHSNPSEPRIACSCTSQILFFQARTSQLHSLAARCPEAHPVKVLLGSWNTCLDQKVDVYMHAPRQVSVHTHSSQKINQAHTAEPHTYPTSYVPVPRAEWHTIRIYIYNSRTGTFTHMLGLWFQDSFSIYVQPRPLQCQPTRS